MNTTPDGNLSVGKQTIDAWLGEVGNEKGKMDDARSAIATGHKALVDDHGLNKRGLTMFKQLHNMNAEKRADVRRTLDYLVGMYEDEWNEQPDLLDDEAA